MKNVAVVPFLTLILLTGLFYSCSKKETPVPDFPQLIGNWTGTTSQGNAITLWVNSVNGYLYITSSDLMVYGPSGNTNYKQYNPNGLAVISNKQFHLTTGSGSSGEAFIDGTFDLNDMSLNGNFAVYPPANTVDRITGTYTAYKK